MHRVLSKKSLFAMGVRQASGSCGALPSQFNHIVSMAPPQSQSAPVVGINVNAYAETLAGLLSTLSSQGQVDLLKERGKESINAGILTREQFAIVARILPVTGKARRVYERFFKQTDLDFFHGEITKVETTLSSLRPGG